MLAPFPQHFPKQECCHGRGRRHPKRIHQKKTPSFLSLSPAVGKAAGEPPPISSQDKILRFHRLLSDGRLEPLHHRAFPSLFKACRQLSAVEEGRQLHAQAIKRCFLSDIAVQRSLIRMYAKFLACQDALKVFDRCSDPDVVSQNDLIVGLCKVRDLDSARKVFDGMTDRNVVSWSILVDGYARNGQMDVAQRLFDAMPERNHYSWNSLICGYLTCHQVGVARRIFDSMRPVWNVVTWTAMISGYVQNCQYKEALDLFLDMQVNGVVPNKVTIVSILPAVAQLGALAQGRWIHSYLDKMDMEVDSILGCALINMYSKCGCIEDAIEVFENLEHKKLSAWNAIISGLAAHGRGRDALFLFWRMREFEMVPNELTFTAVLSACSHSSFVEEGLAVFDLFTKFYKLKPNIRHYGCMVDLLARAGCLKEAVDFVEQMPVEPNSVIWKSLISGCRRYKNAELADYIWRKIINLGPQDSGFYTLISNIFNEVGRTADSGEVRKHMNDLQVHKVAGCSWVELDGFVHEFLMGKESFHAQSMEIRSVLLEMESLMRLEEYNTDQIT